MRGRTPIAAVVGATLGALIAVAALALAGTRVVEDAVDATLLDPGTLRSRAEFIVSRGGFNVLVLVGGALGGAAIGAVGHVVGRETGGGRRISPAPLVVIGGLLGAIVAYATGTAALGIAAGIEDGIITLSVYRAIVVAIVVGGVLGGAVGGTIARISDPEVLGLEGDAWPANPVAFAREAISAIGIPLIAAIVGIGIAFALSQVLLEASHLTALIVFGGVGAVVLFGAAFLAAHPPKKRSEPADR